jgi:serine/threonine protein kinase
MPDAAMSRAEVESAVLSDVVARFTDHKDSTRRQDLIVKYRNSNVLTDLASRNVLRRKNAGSAEEYLPTAAAFEFSGNDQLKRTAKLGLTVVLHALQDMGLRGPKEVGYTLDDLKRHVEGMFPKRSYDVGTLALGLYLAQDFGVFDGYRFNAPDDTEIVWFKIGEGAITMQDIDGRWDIVTANYAHPDDLAYGLRSRDDIDKSLVNEGNAAWEEVRPLGSGGQSIVSLVRRPIRVKERFKSINALNRPPWPTKTDGADRIKILGEFAEAVWQYARPDEPVELGARKVFKIEPEGSAPEPLPGSDQHRAISRLKNEITVLREDRRGLPQLLDADIAQRWIVTEYFEQGTLEKQPLRYRGQVHRALKAFRSLVETVSFIHKDGYVHRDIKPANVFIRETDELVLGDFGIVFIPGSHERVTFTDERVGPRDYMPQWGDLGERLENVEANFDVYMLGKLLWCMVSGRHKLPREYHRKIAYSLAAQFPNTPEIRVVNDILDKCVVEEPDDCLKSARELLDLVDNSLAVLGSGAPQLDGHGNLILPCRICGKGFYQEHTTASLQTGAHPLLLRVFVCNVCTHYEFFAPGNPEEAAQRGWKPWRTN